MKNVRLAEARRATMMTMEQLSQATGINSNRLYGLEWGRLRVKPREARLIGLALGREVQELFPDGMRAKGQR